VIPYISPEFIAALHNKPTGERNNSVIGASLMKHDVAKAICLLIAPLVSKWRASKGKKTFRSQPPSTHTSTLVHCSAQRKNALHLDKIVAVIDAEEISGLSEVRPCPLQICVERLSLSARLLVPASARGQQICEKQNTLARDYGQGIFGSDGTRSRYLLRDS
jgi:hypothetical protein